MRRFFPWLERFDWVLFFSVLTLTAIGAALIYGIGLSQEQLTFTRFHKQILASFLGLGLVISLVFLDYRHLRSIGLMSYLGGTILLFLVLFLGTKVNGTVGWFQIGGFSFQPVELTKITLILYLAAFFSRRARGQLTWPMFLQSGAATGLYLILILLQPDFGSAMVMLGIWFILCLFIGLPKRAFLILPLLGILFGAGLWEFGLKPYQRARILTFTNQSTDTQDTGYNAAQARIAIGSGGWFGKGLGEGSQARLRFLPEASTDFIFAVLGEELGFVGVSLCLILFFLVIQRYLAIAQASEDDFAALLLVGLASILTIHVTVNAGMNLGLLPITGIPMPFLSAAASSLVVMYLGLGFAESIAIRRRIMM